MLECNYWYMRCIVSAQADTTAVAKIIYMYVDILGKDLVLKMVMFHQNS